MYYKETPLRLIRSENGEITYLVEWNCPECSGSGCTWCKCSGVMDGLAYALYNQGPRHRNRLKEAGAKRRKK